MMKLLLISVSLIAFGCSNEYSPIDADTSPNHLGDLIVFPKKHLYNPTDTFKFRFNKNVNLSETELLFHKVIFYAEKEPTNSWDFEPVDVAIEINPNNSKELWLFKHGGFDIISSSPQPLDNKYDSYRYLFKKVNGKEINLRSQYFYIEN